MFLQSTCFRYASVNRAWLSHFLVYSSLCVIVVLSNFSALHGTTTLPYKEEILEAAHLVNRYWINHNELGNAGWARAAYYTGNQRFYEITGESFYLERAIAWGNDNGWLRGPEGDFHADAHCCGQSYIDLYQLDPESIRIEDIVRVMDLTVESPLVDRWSWIDAFYMAGPTLAKLGALQEDSRYTNKLWDMYYDMGWRRGLFDVDEGLWYRDTNWFYPEHKSENGRKIFWSRGNGWVIAGIVRVLSELPEDHPHRSDFISMLQTMAAALVPLQGQDGFWRASLLDPADVPNPETSGTGFFTYALAWGIRMGYLDEAFYLPVVARAWNGLNEISVHPDGFLGYVQTPASSPDGADYEVTRDYGVGAYLLAASELSLLAQAAPFLVDAGLDQRIVDWDDDGWSRCELIGSVIAEEDLIDTALSWWEGEELIGTGERCFATLPLGSHRIKLVAQAGHGVVTSTTSIQVVSGGSADFVSAPGFQEPNGPENLFDGNLDTRLSIEGVGQEIIFSWASVVEVRALQLAFYFGDERTAYFHIDLSLNGDTWTRVVTDGVSSGDTLNLQRFPFAENECRYLRLTGNGNSVSFWNSYTEALVEFMPRLVDEDGDGIPDIWELNYLGSTRHAHEDDLSHDGVSIIDEFKLALDPVRTIGAQFWISREADGRFLLHVDRLPLDSPGYEASSPTVFIERSYSLKPGSWESVAIADRPLTLILETHQLDAFYRLKSGAIE